MKTKPTNSMRSRVRRTWHVATIALSAAACYGQGYSRTAAYTPPPEIAHPTLARDADAADAMVAYAQTLPLGARMNDVRAISSELDQNEASTKRAFGAVWQELAREVRAGSVDADSIRPFEDAAVAALDAHVDREAAALDRLHDLLGPNERGMLVANFRNDQTVRLTGAEMKPGRAGRLANLTQRLGLDADQQRQVASILDAQPVEDFESDRDARITRVADQFPTSTFDARRALAGDTSPETFARAKIEHKAAFLQQIVPILRPDQRERLAAHLESMPH